jgi:hypothetical protein
VINLQVKQVNQKVIQNMANLPVSTGGMIGLVAATSTSTNQPNEFNHQTFQTWIDTLVDSDSSEETKLKAIQDLSLNLEVIISGSII